MLLFSHKYGAGMTHGRLWAYSCQDNSQAAAGPVLDLHTSAQSAGIMVERICLWPLFRSSYGRHYLLPLGVVPAAAAAAVCDVQCVEWVLRLTQHLHKQLQEDTRRIVYSKWKLGFTWMRKPAIGYQFIWKWSFLSVKSLVCVVSTNITLNECLFPFYMLSQHAALLVIDGKLLVFWWRWMKVLCLISVSWQYWGWHTVISVQTQHFVTEQPDWNQSSTSLTEAGISTCSS